MVNENNKPFELVQEIDNKYEVPSFEEFMKSYEVDERLINSYNFEVDSYKDISVGKLSGPMPFVDEATALIVARADTIMVRLSRDYPNIVEIFKHNPKGTVEWLKAEGALVGYNVVHKFEINFEGKNDTERSGPKAWQEYRNKIEEYVADRCKEWSDKGGNFESRLRPAVKALSDHIHEKHEKSYSRWPEVGGLPNVGSIELNIGGSYEADGYYILWSCIGWMSIADERPRKHVYRAEFRGSPDMKILQIDLYMLRDLNRRVNSLREGVEEAKRMIDAKEGTRDPKILTWEDFK